MSGISIVSTTKSEWIKFRSVRSTLYNVITIFVLSIGLGALISFAAAHDYVAHPERQIDFEPLRFSLVGIFFAQFVVGVLGSMFITSEYSTGTIRTTLAAVPRRTMMVIGKIIVMLASVFVISELITFIAFLIGQAIFKANRSGNVSVPNLTLSSPGALRGVIFAGLYLVLLAAIGFGLGLILRKSVAAIVVFVVVLLVLPILAALLPSSWGNPILRYLPSELGRGMMSINQASGTFSPTGSLLVLSLYAVALVVGGAWLLNTRDA